ncbi:MAG: sulfatase-like hydrolase/transferase [Opitutaceae bacterium]
MNTKQLLLTALAFAVSGLFVNAEQSQPNVVVFLADDMGWGDSATYGHELIQTPNLDKLASQGVKFTQCYSAAGVCSPARGAILTGRTPYRNGVWRHLSGNGPSHLRESEITYPELLQAAGYETCHVGKWHLNSKQMFNNPDYPQPNDHGYDYWMSTHNNASPSHKNPVNFVRNGEELGVIEGYSAPFVAQEAVNWMKDVRDPKKPFALSVWVHEPHKPIATDDRFQSLYDGHKNSQYMGNITQLDYALGMVMDALDAQGLSDNTLLIFTSDNGPEGQSSIKGGSTGGLRGRKRNDYEGGIRVPGVVRWPEHIQPATVSETPMIGSDVFATVLDVCGISLPTDRVIDGTSMVPAFAGKSVDRKVPMFWRTHVSGPDDRVAMRIGDWKIVGDETLTEFKLFNIPKDHQETNDLATKMPEKTEEMTGILLNLWSEIEAEGPSEWWKNEKQRPQRGSKMRY